MNIGTVLVVLAVVLAAIALFVRGRTVTLLAFAVIAGFVGVLLGVGTISFS